jgi:hypothetical protein
LARRYSSGTNRFFTHSPYLPPGFEALRIRTGTSASGPPLGFLSREKRNRYCPSGNLVSSSMQIVWNSAVR